MPDKAEGVGLLRIARSWNLSPEQLWLTEEKRLKSFSRQLHKPQSSNSSPIWMALSAAPL